jgi:hypothetical protein
MASIISAGTTSATALNMSADTSGVLQLASNNGVVALTVGTSQNIGIGTTTPFANYKLEVNGNVFANNLVLNDGGATIGTGAGGNVGSIAGAAMQLFGVSTGQYMLFATNSNERMRITSTGGVAIGGQTALGLLTVSGNIAPIAAPSANWGIDFGTSTSAGSYVTLANGATYDLADGAGCVWIYEQTSSVGLSIFNCAYGGTSIVANPQNNYTTTVGTASKTNVYYNGGNNKYRIQNNSGATYSYWIAGMRVRNNA